MAGGDAPHSAGPRPVGLAALHHILGESGRT